MRNSPRSVKGNSIIARRADSRGTAQEIDVSQEFLRLTDVTTPEGFATLFNSDNLAIEQHTFRSDGTWTKPHDAVAVDIEAVGGGGGGGSGAWSHNPEDWVSGGMGGGGGSAKRISVLAHLLPDVVEVTVGVGGAGGPPAVSPGNGQTGGTGGISSFGDILYAYGGGGGLGGRIYDGTPNLVEGGAGAGIFSSATAGGGMAGEGGGTGFNGHLPPGLFSGGSGYWWVEGGGEPVDDFTDFGVYTIYGSAGGGGGGAVGNAGDAGPLDFRGGKGARSAFSQEGGDGGQEVGAPGQAGRAPAEGIFGGSSGGGGGAASDIETLSGGRGGMGTGGSGGGGGGAYIGLSGRSGAGGPGGSGFVRVTVTRYKDATPAGNGTFFLPQLLARLSNKVVTK